jgi:hypothetical protein
MRIRPPTLSGVALGAVVVLIVTATGATAAALITGADIKNGTVASKDLKNNDVKSDDIKNNNVKSGDIKDGQVSSADIKNGGVASGDIKDGAVASADLQNNSVASADILDGTLTLNDINNATEQELFGFPVVTAPGGGWSASGLGAAGLSAFTPDGVVFGPFTNSAQQFGTVRYEGTDVVGLEVHDIAELTYSTGFNGTSNEPPYLRILTDVNGDGFNFENCCEPHLDDHEFLFMPSRQPAGSVGTDGRLIKYETIEGEWDYDLPLEQDLSWDQLVTAHGEEPIFLIAITAGGSALGTTDAFLNSFSYELAGSAPVKVSFSE